MKQLWIVGLVSIISGCASQKPDVATVTLTATPTATPTPTPTPMPAPAPTPAPPTQTDVFIGDSLVANWNLADAFPDQSVTNKGIGGNSADDMLARFQTDALASNPNVVVIWGSNNNDGIPITEEQIEADWQSMFQMAQKAGVRVVFIALSPRRDQFADANPSLLRLNAWLQSFSTQTGAHFADIWATLLGSDGELNSNYSLDGAHINAAGYAAIQPIVQAQL